MSIFTQEQNAVLLRDLRPGRVAKRRMGGKDLSYMEAYEIRAHLIRLFGFGGFSIETLSCEQVYQRDVEVGSDKKPGWEVAYKAHVELTVKGSADLHDYATYSEVAIGSAIGSVGLGDLHDNAAKSAVSDAMKRCAINLGTQFGLSLYENGRTTDIVRNVVGLQVETEPRSDEAQARLEHSLGAQVVAQEDTKTNEATPIEDPPEQGGESQAADEAQQVAQEGDRAHG